MRYLEKKLRAGLIALMGVLLLAGCGRAEDLRVEQEEVPIEEEAGPPTWEQRYASRSSTVAESREAVLFQQACEGGFLAYINRKVRENIPAELKEDPEFVNDGSYDVFESALFRVSENGEREKVRRYRPLAAPEKTEEVEKYFSESRPRAFRIRGKRRDCRAGIQLRILAYQPWISEQKPLLCPRTEDKRCRAQHSRDRDRTRSRAGL